VDGKSTPLNQIANKLVEKFQKAKAKTVRLRVDKNVTMGTVEKVRKQLKQIKDIIVSYEGKK